MCQVRTSAERKSASVGSRRRPALFSLPQPGVSTIRAHPDGAMRALTGVGCLNGRDLPGMLLPRCRASRHGFYRDAFYLQTPLHVGQFRATKPSPCIALASYEARRPLVNESAVRHCEGGLPSFSSAIFCASITSPMGRFPSGPKHHAAERAPASSSSSIFIWWARRMR